MSNPAYRIDYYPPDTGKYDARILPMDGTICETLGEARRLIYRWQPQATRYHSADPEATEVEAYHRTDTDGSDGFVIHRCVG